MNGNLNLFLIIYYLHYSIVFLSFNQSQVNLLSKTTFHLYIFILSAYSVNGTFVISNITIQTDGNIKYYFSHSLYYHC